MKDLITFVYKSETDQASEVFRVGAEVVEKENLSVLHGAVIVKDAMGMASIKETSDWTAGKGAGRGGLYGLIIGIVFGGPLFGALLGTVVGSVWGGSDARKTISPEFARWLGSTLEPDDSAIMMVVAGETDEDHNHAIQRMKQIASGGEFYRTMFLDETEAALEKALENEEIARAAEESIRN